MIKKMSLARPALFAALWCGVSAASALAQDQPPAANPGPLTTPPALLPLSSPPPAPPQMQHGPRDQHGPPRGNPLFDALDTNHDGTISAEEIANASTSLKALLKNGSDHLTREDLRPAGGPPPPPHAAPAPGDQPKADGQAEPPRPKIGAIRPHNPPPRGPEDDAPEAGPRHLRPPAPDREQAAEDFDRPRFHREERREERREWRQSLRMHEEEMADTRPFDRHERLSRHQGPPRPEDGEDMDHDARPPHHDDMDRRESGPMHRDEADRREGPPMHGEEADHEAGPRHHGPPPMPLFDALDTNHDGTISADEIANASAALKGLLKNGSDHLTREDLRTAGGQPPMGH